MFLLLEKNYRFYLTLLSLQLQVFLSVPPLVFAQKKRAFEPWKLVYEKGRIRRHGQGCHVLPVLNK